MAKIDFSKLARQPKYAIPLLVLPFGLIALMILQLKSDDEPVAQPASEVIVDLPNAVDEEELSKTQLMEQKLQEERANERHRADSVNAVLLARRNDSIMRMNQASQARQKETAQRLNNYSTGASSSYSNASSRKSGKEEEMTEFERFKKEMELLDQLSNPETVDQQLGKRTDTTAKREPELVTKVTNEDSGYFQTVRDKLPSSHIMAMVDDVVKGGEGMRVRIRLLDKVAVGGHTLEPGTYLYAFISGFSTKRVMLSVPNILVEDEIIPVDLQVYDLDANQGLYVPNSNFAEFVNDAGANVISQANVSVNQSGASQLTQMGYQALQSFLNSGKQSVSQQLKKNKAKIKYNTQVILVNGRNG